MLCTPLFDATLIYVATTFGTLRIHDRLNVENYGSVLSDKLVLGCHPWHDLRLIGTNESQEGREWSKYRLYSSG